MVRGSPDVVDGGGPAAPAAAGASPPPERAEGAAARPVRVVWDRRFLEYDFGPSHPFTERSRASAVRLLELSLDGAETAAFEWTRDVALPDAASLERFHDSEYLGTVRTAADTGTPAFLDQGDTPSFRGCYDAAARIVAGTLAAHDVARLPRGRGFAPAGGLHHAGPERASGFCIFNDVAVAIATALEQGRRVAYLDIDAHHGDGVMYGFYGDGRVLDIDFHQDGRTLFPGTGRVDETGSGDGAGRKVNVPLPPGSGDEALLPLARRLLPPLLREHRPQVLVLQHGVDGHLGDPLAGLGYTGAGYAAFDRLVLDLADETGAGLLVTGGGGYRFAAVSRVLAATGRALGGLSVPPPSARLPDPWRAEYSALLREPAPTTWGDGSGAARRSSPGRLEALVHALELALGRKFPRESEASPAG